MNTLRLSRAGALALVLVILVSTGPAQALALSATLPQPMSGTTGQPSAAFAAKRDEILVKFEENLSPEITAQLHSRLKGTPIARIPILDVQVVRVPADHLEEALEAYNHTPGVAYAEPNYTVQALDLPDDPLLSKQWNLQAIHAPEAWDLSHGDGVTIAIIDTGVQPNDPDLKDKLVPGYDFVNNDREPWDDHGHGRRVALVAAAATNNGIGIAGVGYNARIMPLKALDATGLGTHSWLAAAIVWAASHGADVINLSLGGPFPSRTLSEAIDFAWNQGAVLVAAAGNEGSDVVTYPAAYPSVMAVVATTPEMQRAFFSNYGRYVSVAAPGVGIIAGQEEGGSVAGRGTSLATPHVAGVAALVVARNPSLTNTQIRAIIEQTADDLGEPGWDPYYGHGLINAYRAVQQAAPTDAGSGPREAMVEAVNAVRREHALPTLRSAPRLMELAQRRAEVLASQCIDTTAPDDMWTCLVQATHTAGGSEIAVIGAETVQAAIEVLLTSPEGRQMVLGPYRELGVGMVESSNGSRPTVWLLHFGPGRAGPITPPPIGVLSVGKTLIISGP